MQLFFFFQAEDGIRDLIVTGVQTCALPIYFVANTQRGHFFSSTLAEHNRNVLKYRRLLAGLPADQIGRASCRERVEISVVAVSLKKKKTSQTMTSVGTRQTRYAPLPT